MLDIVSLRKFWILWENWTARAKLRVNFFRTACNTVCLIEGIYFFLFLFLRSSSDDDFSSLSESDDSYSDSPQRQSKSSLTLRVRKINSFSWCIISIGDCSLGSDKKTVLFSNWPYREHSFVMLSFPPVASKDRIKK